jgi:hypothetical protein
MNDTPNPIAAISRAGGMTGPTSDPAWHHLVATYGEINVGNLVIFLYQKSRQPVTVADARREFAERERIFDDESEGSPLPALRPSATPARPPEPPRIDQRTASETRIALLQRIDQRRISRAVAAEEIGVSLGILNRLFGEHSVSPAIVTACIRWLNTRYTDPQDQPMKPNVPNPLIAQMMDQIKARKVTITIAAQQIGIHESALYKARTTGTLSPLIEQKIASWLAGPVVTAMTPELKTTFEKVVFKKADGEEPTKPTPRQSYQVDDLVDVTIDRNQNNSGVSAGTGKKMTAIRATLDGRLDRMDAIALGISRLTYESPREAGILARMYANLADEEADDETARPLITVTQGGATTAPTWKGGAL